MSRSAASRPATGTAPGGRSAPVPGSAPGPGESPGFLFWRITLRWQRAMAASLKPLGLTHVQFVLLASTWWLTHVAGEVPTQRRLADHAGTDPMMTSQVVRALEAKNLIIRSADPVDSRARRMGVSRQGAALAQRAIAIVEATDAEFFAPAGQPSGLLETLRSLAG